jgi:hypothetical protein
VSGPLASHVHSCVNGVGSKIVLTYDYAKRPIVRLVLKAIEHIRFVHERTTQPCHDWGKKGPDSILSWASFLDDVYFGPPKETGVKDKLRSLRRFEYSKRSPPLEGLTYKKLYELRHRLKASEVTVVAAVGLHNCGDNGDAERSAPQ